MLLKGVMEMKDHVWIPSRNKRLSAMVHVPDGFNGQTPVIVCCHGFTGDKVGYNQLTVNLAKALEAGGYGVVRFDYLGSGDSDGEFAGDTSVAGWKEDLDSVLAWVRDYPPFAGQPLLLYGHSLGGLIVLTYPDEQRRIAGRLVFAPVTSPVDNFREIILGPKLWQAALEGAQISRFYGKGFKLNSQFVKDLAACRYNPGEVMAGIATPLLLVHGTRDVVVPIRYSRDFFAGYPGPKEFQELDLEHSAENDQEALQSTVLNWLGRQFPV